MTYAVRLVDVYEGPLDLLLQLVSKERVDVADISISTITDEYLQAVKAMGEIDLNIASSFLILAATLLELKSFKLLPKQSSYDPELAALLEERDHLIHRLIEYSTFKNAAVCFAALFEANEGYFCRDAELPEEFAAALPDIFDGLTVDRVLTAAVAALTPKPRPVVDITHVTPIRVSVGEMIEMLVQEFQSRQKTMFSELKEGAADKIEVVVRFLALLELFKSQMIDLDQPTAFGDITIRWRSPVAGTT
ncbi:MAG: ScpA family protein [Actinomycetota bacterium]